jgi:hypothetical protein
MTNLNPRPYLPYQCLMSLNLPQAPAHVWAQLSPAQQQQVHQTLAQVCRQLVHQIKSREQPHDQP